MPGHSFNDHYMGYPAVLVRPTFQRDIAQHEAAR